MDFKIYNEQVKPLEVDSDFDPSKVQGFVIGRDDLYLVPRIGAKLTSNGL